MNTLKPYPTYKPAGVPWLQQVPKHWEVVPNRALFREIKESGRPADEMLSVTIGRGVLKQAEHLATTTKKDSSRKDKSTYKHVEVGDIVYNKMRAWQGAFGVSKYSGIVSPAYVVQRPTEGSLPEFYHFLLRTPLFAKEAERNSYGLASDIWNLRPEDFRTILSVRPPIAEQHLIVRYLHALDAKVKRYIRSKRSLIARLQEQKQAIIQQAVTRGLDPTVELKPSGVEWLGEVPVHWEVVKVKRIGSVKIGLIYSPADLTGDKGTLVLRASNIRYGRIVSADNVYVSKEIPTHLRVAEGDILICVRSGSRSLVGKSAMITAQEAGVSYGAFMSLLRSNDNAFVYWVLNSNLLPSVMAQFETSTINQLTQHDLKNLILPYPPISERKRIVEYLALATARMDASITIVEKEIAHMHEYHTRLIADVVTGAVDVRTAAQALPADQTIGGSDDQIMEEEEIEVEEEAGEE